MIVVIVGIGAELAIAAGGGEEVENLSPKDLRQGPGGEQEALPGRGEPAVLVRAQAAIGDDAVDMDVPSEVLAPGVQHHGDAELAAEPARIAAELEQGPGRGLEQERVDDDEKRLREGIEIVRQREHRMLRSHRGNEADLGLCPQITHTPLKSPVDSVGNPPMGECRRTSRIGRNKGTYRDNGTRIRSAPI